MTSGNTLRTWRDIATEFVNEPDPWKVAILAIELAKALEEGDRARAEPMQMVQPMKAA